MNIDRLRMYLHLRPKTKKIIGVLFVCLGFLALVTPLTPGSWLALVGFELLGIRLLFFDRFVSRFAKKPHNVSNGTEII